MTAVDGTFVAEQIGTAQRPLVKIDVEGVGVAVVRSLAPLLARTDADLVIEVLPEEVDALNGLRLRETHRLWHILNDGLVERSAFIASPSHRDYLLTRRSI